MAVRSVSRGPEGRCIEATTGCRECVSPTPTRLSRAPRRVEEVRDLGNDGPRVRAPPRHRAQSGVGARGPESPSGTCGRCGTARSCTGQAFTTREEALEAAGLSA